MYAVVKTGGKQFKVEEGAEAVVEKLDAEVGDSVDFEVLFYTDDDKTVAEPDALEGAKVTAEVLEHFKDDKVVVFKFKKRKGYKRTKGHRQPLTRVRITGIEAPKGAPKRKVAKAAPAPEKVEREEQPATAEAEPVMCAAVTAAGNPCKNKAREGSRYCGVHAKLEEEE